MSDEEYFEERTTPPPAEEGAPLWMATFGDMMSLLLVFFILLFSMSELKMDRFLLASQSLREAMGGTAAMELDDPTGLMPDPVDPDLQMQNPGMTEGAVDANAIGQGDLSSLQGAPAAPSVSEILADKLLDDIARRIEAFVAERDLQDVLSVDRGDAGVRVRIQASALFGSGVGTVYPGSEWIIEFIAELTADITVPVVVSGHADDRPIATRSFASNWELSAVRAGGVARMLESLGHPGDQIVVESFGAFRPIDTNETAEGRARNRRVEFYYDRADIVRVLADWREAVAAPEG